MAGFNFKKLTKDKNKNKGNTSTNTHGSPQNSSKFMHFNLNGMKGHESKNDFNRSDNSIENSYDKNRSVSNSSKSPLPPPANQNGIEYMQHRVFPTPSNNQRNVSGATQLMQLQQQQRQTSNSSSLRTNNSIQQQQQNQLQQQQQQQNGMVQSTPQHTQNQMFNNTANNKSTTTNNMMNGINNTTEKSPQQQFHQNSQPSRQISGQNHNQQDRLHTPQLQQYFSSSPNANQQTDTTPATRKVSVNDSTATNNPTNPNHINNNNFQNKIIWNRIKLKNSPFPRYRHVASSYSTNDGRIFVIGGLHDQSVYGDIWIIKSIDNGTKFLSSTIDITDLTPPPRVGHASTLCGNAFIIFGGDTHKVNKDGLMDDDLYLFNINSYKWTIPNPVGPRPLGRYGHKISIIAKTPLNTKLYLFGGQFDDTYFNNLSMFDLSSFRKPESHWEFLKPKTFVPPPLTNHTMVSFDNKLWVFGGDTLQGLINKLFMFDPDLNDWSVIDTFAANNDSQNIPPPMQEHAAIIFGNLMCIVGGKDEFDDYLNTVYFLNMSTFKWFKFPTILAGLPQGRSGHSLSLLDNNKLLIMGGDKFDYAKPDEYDLHTSEIDLNSGTLLYTLDLTNLDQLCPGINERSLSDTLKDGMGNLTPTTPPTGIQSLKNSSPTNDPRNNNNVANAQGKNANITTLNKNNHGFQIDINKLPEIAAHNILTPYTNAEAQKTPLIEGNESFNRSDQIMPNPTRMEPGLIDNNSDLNENNVGDIKNNNDGLPSKQIAAPVLLDGTHLNNKINENTNSSDVNSKSDKITEPFNENDDNNKLKSFDEQNTPEKQSDTFQLAETSISNSQDNSKNVPQSDDDQISNENLKDSSKNTDTITRSETNNSVSNASSNTITIDKNILQDLKNELVQIKTMTNAKIAESSETMRLLESENRELKEQLLNQNNDNAAINDNTITDSNQMTNAEVNELHSIIDDNVIDIKTLNNIIKRQNTIIEKVTLDDMFKDKYDELQRKYDVLLEENIKLKAKVNGEDIAFTESVKNYSNQIDKLLLKWSTNTELKKNGGKAHSDVKSLTDDHNDSDNELDSEGNTANTKNNDHKTVVSKLSKQLDDLLIKSQGLSESRERLDAEYHKLEKKHRTLSQDLLSQQDGSDNHSNNGEIGDGKDNKLGNNLVIDTVRKLELAQLELENFRDKNKLLQVEIEKLKSSQKN